MTIEQAAQLLHQQIGQEPWYFTTGIGATEDGRPCLYVYTRVRASRKACVRFLDDGWKGFPVKVCHFGRIQPMGLAAPTPEGE